MPSGRALTQTNLLDALPDDELDRLNDLLPWAAFVVDGKGRRLGRSWSKTKRNAPQPLMDARIARWNQRTPLAGRSVLEVGCFEGIHTTALCRLGATVTAVDSRIENVVKTLARCAMLNAWPRVVRWDLEGSAPDALELGWDLVLHIGVLYHLSNPLAHLQSLATWTREGLLLDTHVAPKDASLEDLRAGEQTVRCSRYREQSRSAPFAGMRSHSLWIVEEDLVRCLRELGFSDVDVAERRAERNGPRVLIYASR